MKLNIGSKMFSAMQKIKAITRQETQEMPVVYQEKQSMRNPLKTKYCNLFALNDLFAQIAILYNILFKIAEYLAILPASDSYFDNCKTHL